MTEQALVNVGQLAQQLRVDSIRCSTAAGPGHPTSSMSAADVMAVLLAHHFRYDWDRPDNPTNDHLIFSKGHASPLLYSMFKAAGAITDEELMTGYRRFGSRLEGHPTSLLPWVGVATRLARPRAAGRSRGGCRLPVSRRAPLPGVGAVRRQRDGRRVYMGGIRQG